jgi:putative transposase
MTTNHPRRNRKTTRLQKWNYGWAGVYFITICTKHRIHYFGKIENQKMILSPVGIIADILWYEIKNHAKNVELGSFVVMPNHVHGIITITADAAPGKNTISSMVGGYKSAVSKHAHRLGYEMEWQVRFWDNIIRDDAAMQRVTAYIENNIKNWNDDEFNE